MTQSAESRIAILEETLNDVERERDGAFARGHRLAEENDKLRIMVMELKAEIFGMRASLPEVVRRL